jgi:hypothetical protein
MRRLLAVAALAAVAAAAARALRGPEEPLGMSGNGHAPDESRRAAVRERIVAAQDRLHGRLDQLRGE